MVDIIAHRGNIEGPDTTADDPKYLKGVLGEWGLELDFRFYEDALIVSHDEPKEGPCLSGRKILETILDTPSPSLSAINIKDEESLPHLLDFFISNPTEKCFLFDFELALHNKERQEKWVQLFSSYVRVAARISEKEGDHAKLLSEGYRIFWLDCWSSEIWYDAQLLSDIHARNGLVYAVSPELHKNKTSGELEKSWTEMKNLQIDGICTDFPKLCAKVVNADD